jgi:Rap1a immunity proteins
MARHKHPLWVVLVGLLLVVSATSSNARDVRADGLLVLHNAGDVSAATYVNGIMSGFDHANARLIAEGQRPLYCQRPDQTLSANEVLDVTRKAIGQTPQKGRFSATLIILHILIEAFPCTSLPITEPREVDSQVISHKPGSRDASVLLQEERRQGDELLTEPAQPLDP